MAQVQNCLPLMAVTSEKLAHRLSIPALTTYSTNSYFNFEARLNVNNTIAAFSSPGGKYWKYKEGKWTLHQVYMFVYLKMVVKRLGILCTIYGI
ncbi:hypothetical protein Hanom_Chr02g00109591 [Helianthus anomalus]